MNQYSNIIYAHEHTTIDLSSIKQTPDCRLDDQEEVIQEFLSLKQLGVSTIIDQTNRGMGRNPSYVKQVEKVSGIQILQATGYYKEPFLPKECYDLDEIALSKIMMMELTQGIGDSPIKASLIGEIGTSLSSMSEVEKKVFQAAARAHADTGAPICTHTTLGKLGLMQVNLLSSYSVDLSRVVISHMDLCGDVEEMLRLLDRGVNIGFDTVGKTAYQTDQHRADCLSMLCKQGFSNQIVLSVDITRKSSYRTHGGIGYAYLIEEFLPMLQQQGCTNEQIKSMLCLTPSRIYHP